MNWPHKKLLKASGLTVSFLELQLLKNVLSSNSSFLCLYIVKNQNNGMKRERMI